MKKILLLVLLLFSAFSFAQKFNKFVQADIDFKDGTKKSGYVVINTMNDKIIFKQSEHDEAVRLSGKEVDGLVLIHAGDSLTLRYKQANDRRAPRLLYALVDNDNASLYISSYRQEFYGGEAGLFITQLENTYYYFVKNRSERAYYIGDKELTSRKLIGKFAKKHLSDCPDLVKRAKNKEFKIRDIVTVIKLYNNCSKK